MNFDHASRRLLLQSALAACAAAATLPTALAQGSDWPKAQTITLVVPFTAGSGTDVIARTLAEKLGALLGTRVIVDNKPGAGGTLGAALVAKAPNDGTTLLIHSSGHVVNPAIFTTLPYDTLKDFEGITALASLPNVLVVSPAKGYKDVRDLVAKARAAPGTLNYASAGNGSATHMNAEKFRVTAGLKAEHIPYKGTPEAMSETMSGRIDWFFAPLVSALPLIKDGKLQALAVGTATRSSALPQVPSIVESGLADATYTFWVGMFAPAKTPRANIDRLHAETLKVLAMPEVKERFEKLGAAAMPMAQAEFEKFIGDETAAAAKLVQAAGIKAN